MLTLDLKRKKKKKKKEKEKKDNVIIFLILLFANRVNLFPLGPTNLLMIVIFMIIKEYLFKVQKHLDRFFFFFKSLKN
jgi:hypothetical protein